MNQPLSQMAQANQTILASLPNRGKGLERHMPGPSWETTRGREAPRNLKVPLPPNRLLDAQPNNTK